MITIREIAVSDADAAARLSHELGYPADAETIRQRIRSRADLPDNAIFVACIDGVVNGWIDVGVVRHLQAEATAEIGGFIVSSGQRRTGIGAALIARGEQWARERGMKRMVVRSQIKREAAHRFYLREGYDRTKTSTVFVKPL